MPRIRQLTATLFRRAEESTRPLVRLADAMADAEAVAAIYRPVVEGSAISFEERAPDPAEMEQRMARTLERTPWLVAELNRKVVGYAYATQHRDRPAYRWSVEISVYVDPDHQGQGVGRLLYQGLLDLLRQQGYINVYAGVSLPNPASEALHRAVGMRLMGVFPKAGFKRGRWWHVAWYGMRLHRGEGEPSEPIALPELE